MSTLLIFDEAGDFTQKQIDFLRSRKSVPWCAVCDKPVDELTCEQFDYKAAYKYIAKCHGKTQEIELSQFDKMFSTVRLGKAFEYTELDLVGGNNGKSE